MALGAFDFDAMVQAQPLLGPAFFFSFICVVSIGLLGMFLTIIDTAFAQVRISEFLVWWIKAQIGPRLEVDYIRIFISSTFLG